MAEQPALHRIHVIGYAANDRDFPTVALVADPRVAGYQVPKDLSACPDKRYPNHVFTGAQPISGDQRVRHVWEILPSPWVPFTRYDDDLGPVQGRRRSVKNEGQVASLTTDKRTTYEAREGSAIVYTELEETWSVATDDDGNSLFPIRDRDFYDSSRGPVQERRQLFVPTGEEEGSLESVNGVITQTSYEPYNEFLSVKIVQTYKVDGPQLIGKATNNEGQLVTITTQRKGALDYIPPNPSATRTVEANREDAEAIIERVVDAPSVFDSKTLSATKPDVIPDRFAAAVAAKTIQETIAKNAAEEPVLSSDDISGSEERITEFTVRKTLTTRPIDQLPTLDGINYDERFNVGIPYEEIISTTLPTSGIFDAEPIDDERYLIRIYDKNKIGEILNSYSASYPSRINLDLPRILKQVSLAWDEKTDNGYSKNDPWAIGSFSSSLSISDSAQTTATATARPKFDLVFEEIASNNIKATTHILFMEEPTEEKILQRLGAQSWPAFKLDSRVLTFTGASIDGTVSADASSSVQVTSDTRGGVQSVGTSTRRGVQFDSIFLTIPPCIHGEIAVGGTNGIKNLRIQPIAQVQILQIDPVYAPEINFITSLDGPISTSEVVPLGQTPSILTKGVLSYDLNASFYLPPTAISNIPRTGTYLIDSNIEFFKYGFFLVQATTIDASQFA